MTNQTLAATVSRILRQPGMMNMGFNMHGLLVTGQYYSMVAAAIEEGRIECLTAKDLPPQRPGQFAAGTVATARYTPSDNRMMFERENFGSRLSEEITIVHEATHAIFDITAPSKKHQTLAINDESAAVLAEALYIKLCGKPKGNFDMVIGDPQYEAWNLANEMMIETENFTIGPKPYVLKVDQTKLLNNAVGLLWNFTLKPEKGGYADDRGVKYHYDGVPKCNLRATKCK